MKTRACIYSIMTIIVFLLSACAVSPGQEAPGEVQDTLQHPQTMEQTPSPVEAVSATLAAMPQSGLIELRISLDLETEQQCIKVFPFTLRQQDGRILLTGDDDQVSVDCQFKGTICDDSCAALNIIMDMQSRLDGEILSDEAGDGSSRLDLYFFYDGEFIEYFSDFPDDITMTYSESTPLRESAGDLVPVSLRFEDGASVTLMGAGGRIDPVTLPVPIDAALWEITLHLK
jgi:hypothetical protein